MQGAEDQRRPVRLAHPPFDGLQHNLQGEDTSAEEQQLVSLERKITEAKEEMEAALYYERSLQHVATRMKQDATTFDRTISVCCPRGLDAPHWPPPGREGWLTPARRNSGAASKRASGS